MTTEETDRVGGDESTPVAGRPMVFPGGFLLAMVAMGYFPFLHAAGVVTLFVLAAVYSVKIFLPWPCSWRCTWCRRSWCVCLRSSATAGGEIRGELAGVFAMVVHVQWQIVFNRLRLGGSRRRLVPGLYSLWLRIWGSRVGRLVYWSPGLEVLDRSLLDVGDQVVFGIGVRLNPHVLMPDPQTRRTVLQIGRIVLGGAEHDRRVLAGAGRRAGGAGSRRLRCGRCCRLRNSWAGGGRRNERARMEDGKMEDGAAADAGGVWVEGGVVLVAAADFRGDLSVAAAGGVV